MNIKICVFRVIPVDGFFSQQQSFGSLLSGVTVWHYNKHRLWQLFLNHIIHYRSGSSHGAPGIFIAAGSMQKVKNRKLFSASFVTKGGINKHAPCCSYSWRIVPYL